MAMELFDSHAHYDDAAFDGDRDTLLASLPGAGVAGIINAGTSVDSSMASLRLAGRYPFIWAAAGIHPEDAGRAGPEDIEQIARMASCGGKLAAIGEIGLDYHYPGFEKERQLKLFEAQLSLAGSLGLPVIIHDRDAHADTMRLVRQYKPKGVLHCYSGSAEDALAYASMGMYLGFTGVLTFKNSKRAAQAVKALPPDRILIETDCPYMAPEPFRGRRCDSSMLTHTVGRLAQLLGMEAEEAAALTARNARRLFGIG